MNEHTAPSGSRGSPLGRLVRFFLKAFGAVLALIVLPIVAFNIYLSPRPAPRTVRPAGTITVPAPFHIGRAFIDYMTIDGQRLYAGYTSAGLVGVINTTTSQPAGTVTGLGRTHGTAIVAARNLGFATDSEDNTVGVFDLNTQRLL